MKKFSLAYFGSPDFAANFLEKLITDVSMYRYIEVKLIVTQPDQPVGRKQILTPTPVKIVAKRYKIPFFEFKNLGIENSLEIRNWKLEISKLDLALVYAYGELIPKELLNLPKYGFWNIHPSLLPKYRGPSPIAYPLINGDAATGVTIIKMDEEIDHGPIIAQQSLTIDQDDKRPDLEKKLTDLAFEMFKEIMGERNKFFTTWDTPLSAGRVPTGDKKFRSEPYKAQSHKAATYTKKLEKSDGFIKFEKIKLFRNSKLEIRNSSEKIYNLFRGLYPWPGIWTLLPNGKRLKISDVQLMDNELIIKKVQLEGKKEVDFETFNKAYKIFDL